MRRNEWSRSSECARGNGSRKRALACRECQVVGVARIGELVLLGELGKPDVEKVADQVGNDRRARAALRERVLEARDLRDDRRDLLIELEVVVVNEEAAHPPEIEAREEVLEVEIEDIAPALVTAGLSSRIL